mgnify:CR=1 FL=1
MRGTDLDQPTPATRQDGWPAAVEALVVDNGVSGLDVLLAGLTPGTELHRIDGPQNPWSVLSDLWQRPQLQRLHLLGHGQPGELRLGRLRMRQAWLQRLTPPHRQRPLQAICFWSCCTGAGGAGQHFLQGVADLSGSAVFASSTPVGAAQQGGRWFLDVCVEPKPGLSRAAPQPPAPTSIPC